MERQKPVNSVQHNDAYSQALIEAMESGWVEMDSSNLQLKSLLLSQHQRKKNQEAPGPAGGADASTSIPDLSGKEAKSDEGPKDIKASAGAPDPATDLRTGAGVKQSHGARLRTPRRWLPVKAMVRGRRSVQSVVEKVVPTAETQDFTR